MKLIVIAMALAAVLALGGAPAGAQEKQAEIKLGICTSLKDAEFMKKTGYDYVEMGLYSVATMSDEEFAKLKQQVAEAPIKPEAMNSFYRGKAVFVGPKADLGPEVQAYLKQAMARANELGTRILVYGSAGSRKLPEGFPREQAMKQMVDFLRLASDAAKPYPNLTIVVEPLRPQEDNFINTAKQGLELVKMTDRPNVRAFGDLYHMGVQNEPMDAFLEGGAEWIKHVHIARVDGRYYPKAGDSSMEYYKQAFATLRKIGYQGRVSIEGKPEKSLKEDAPESFKVLRALADGKDVK